MAEDVTFSLGQMVPWPAAPGGVAQVCELRRTCVRLYYPTLNGRPRHRTVRAAELAALMRRTPLLFSQHNPFRRGLGPAREKTYTLDETSQGD